MMTIAILAVQGAFAEHEQMLRKCGVSFIELRQKSDLSKSYDGLILPGGESTVQGKLLRELDMFDTLKAQIGDGLPVLATCAGMILLAEKISNDNQTYFQTIPITVKRNAYGRQLGSFKTEEDFLGLGNIPMTFIRAPYVCKAQQPVEILATVDKNIVAVRYQNQIALAFHPELTGNTAIHKLFSEMVETYISSKHTNIIH